jgi:hypothetical protein
VPLDARHFRRLQQMHARVERLPLEFTALQRERQLLIAGDQSSDFAAVGFLDARVSLTARAGAARGSSWFAIGLPSDVIRWQRCDDEPLRLRIKHEF